MKIAIIGAGPTGLYFASLCEKHAFDYTVFEASSYAGGQLTHLYPQKEIVNIPRTKCITAENYIKRLLKKVDQIKIKYNTKIESLDELKQTYDYILIATGIGEYTFRKLGLPDEEKYKVIYTLEDYSFLKNKKVVIFGGGDSALDWARQLSSIADVSLVHRRTEFRGNIATIKDCNIKLYLPYVPEAINDQFITITEVNDGIITSLPYDYILVNFGTEIKKLKFEESDKVFAIGDYLGQTRTLEFGIKSANKTMNKILKETLRNDRI